MSRVIYKLKVAEESARKNKKSGYKNKNFPSAESLPAISRVLVNNGDGTKTPRKIRYCPSEQSIFMDEQDPKSRPEKIRFENGIKIVNTETEPLIYQFMELIDCNGSKETRNTTKRVIFLRDDPVEKAKKKLVEAETLQQKLSSFWEMSESDREAIAQMWGIKTIGKDPSMWQTDLLIRAQAKPQEFVDLVESGDFKIIDVTTRAQKLTILRYFKDEWKFNEVQLCRVPIGVNATIHLMNHLKVHQDTLAAILFQVDKLETRLKAKTVAEQTADANTPAEALEHGMEKIGGKQVLAYNRGIGWSFVDEYVHDNQEGYIFGKKDVKNRNSKEVAIEFIRANPEIKLEIYTRREELQKAKAKAEAEAAENED